MECLGFLVVLIGIWVIISPFVVIALSKRVTEVEQRLDRLKAAFHRQQQPGENTINATSSAEVKVAQSELSELETSAPGPSSAQDQTTSVEPAVVAPALSAHERKPVTPPYLPTALSQRSGLKATHQEVAHPDETLLDAATIIVADEPIRETTPSLMNAADEKGVAPIVAPASSKPLVQTESSALEELLAGKWLTWVGALAVIIGAGFGFKYAVDNGWIGPRERVLLGGVIGLLTFAGGAVAMRRDYRFLGQGLTGAAMGLLYLTAYAAHGWYELVPYGIAFLAMAATTAGGLRFAARFDSQPTAFLGLLGGFLTPAMLHPGNDPFWILFPYILLLDIGVLSVSTGRRWLGLQNLAFVGTCLTWWTWHSWFYRVEMLAPVVLFLTLFFVLFAAIGVMQNIVRQVPAVAGDFFLILLTPLAYFAALYGLTVNLYPFTHGALALAMSAIYGYLAVLNAQINPKGKPVASAMAGIAGTFLILAAPLQFTGHWVTIAWILQSVLLVELGLRYREKTLALTGLALLAKVQFILMIYALGTFADPTGFQTAFVRRQLHLWEIPNVGALNAAGHSWTDIFNGRSLSYLVDVLGMGWLAWQCRRRAKQGDMAEWLGVSGRRVELWLAGAVPLVGLMLAVTETFVWGMVQQWHPLAIFSGFTIWTAVVGSALIAWSVLVGPRSLERVGWFLFALMIGAVVLDIGWILVGISDHGPDRVYWVGHRWLLNAHGLAFLSVLLAATVTAVTYAAGARRERTDAVTDEGRLSGKATFVANLTLDRVFGIGAYLVALMMVLMETLAFGVTRDWNGPSLLMALSNWTAVFVIGLAVWRAVRKSDGLFGLQGATIGLMCLFLIANAFVTVQRAERGALSTTASSTNSAGEMVTAIDYWLLNPRGGSFLIATAAVLLSAWLEWRRERSATQSMDAAESPSSASITVSEQFGVTAGLLGWFTVLVETAAWGMPRWIGVSLWSGLAVGTVPFAIGFVVWATWRRREFLNGVVGLAFGLLGFFLFLATAVAYGSKHGLGWENEGVSGVADWFLHARGLAFLVSLAVVGAAVRLYQVWERELVCERPAQAKTSHQSHSNETNLLFSQCLGFCGWLMGLFFVTTEALIQGLARGWDTETSLAVTLSWIAFALVTLVGGIYWRSGPARVMSLSIFVLTVAKVFLFDVWHLHTAIRVIAFIGLGVTLLLVSFLYRRYRDRIRDWMAPVAGGGRDSVAVISKVTSTDS